jgi:hypothetical protein
LAWLAASLELAENTAKLTFAKPHIIADAHSSTTKEDCLQVFISTVLLHPGTGDQSSYVNESSCWEELFEGKVIAQSFPILARSEEQKGLEMSVEHMAALGNATFMNVFYGLPVLKGFWTMFAATKVAENWVQWHFLSSQGEGRLSYKEAMKLGVKEEHDSNYLLTIVKKPRHFVGWASSVIKSAGRKVPGIMSSSLTRI